MSPRSCVIVSVVAGLAAIVGLAFTVWAGAVHGVAAAVFIAGWLLAVPGLMAVMAEVHRRELVTERLAADLAAANERENAH